MPHRLALVLLLACKGNAKDTTPDDTDVTPPTYTVSVTVDGLDGDGLTLTLGAETLTIDADGTHTFTTPLLAGDRYAVEVSKSPTCPAQRCKVTGGVGSIVDADITGITVSCGDPRLRLFTHSWRDHTLRVTDDALRIDDDTPAEPRVIAGPSTLLDDYSLDSLAYDERRDVLYVVTFDAILAFEDASTAEGDVAPARIIAVLGASVLQGIELDPRSNRAWVGGDGIYAIDDLHLADGEVEPAAFVSGINTNALTRDPKADRLYVSGDYSSTVSPRPAPPVHPRSGMFSSLRHWAAESARVCAA